MSEFRIPPVKRRLRQRTVQIDQENDVDMDELLVLKKRRSESRNKLQSLMDALDANRDYMEKIGAFDATNVKKIQMEKEQQQQELKSVQLVKFDDDYLLDSDNSSDEETEESHIKETARLYLDEDAQENIDAAIDDMKHEEVVESTDCWNQEFFRIGSKSIRQPGLISQELSRSQKEITISELSATSEGRQFLFSHGSMKDWHKGGWICPNYIYQWLFEVVALEPNKKCAKNALSTLFTLWSLPGTKVQTKLPHIYRQRYIELKTFKSILLAYDALPTQLIEGVLSSPEERDVMTHNLNKENYEPSNSRHIPISQLGWMIKAFSFSCRLWAKAYNSYEIRHTVRLLLQLSIDKTGYLVIQEIQTAIDNCLSAMSENNWETEIKMITNDVCDMISSTKRQMHLLDSVKTNYERSRYLRRVIGVTCLERCLEKEVPGSVDYISTELSLIQQMAQIFNHPQGFFKNRENIDYEEVFIRVAMLDSAIGIDDDEIRADKTIVLEIASELKVMGLQIGARLGVMKKTLAHEMIQRVYSRISYIVGRADKYTEL